MKNRTIRIIGVILAIVLLISSFAGCNKEENYGVGDVSTTSPEENTTESTQIPENVNTLTGVADLSEGAIGSRPIAIMVENSPSARPQWGITTPDVVIEGVAEGGITRMMWVYADVEKIPDKVGPIRSARHDFVELAKGMNAIFVHVGGSDGSRVGHTLAYQTIKNLGVNNIDGNKWFGKYFERDKTRTTAIEHRAITKKDYIKSAIAKLGYTTEQKVDNWEPFDVVVSGQSLAWGDSSVTGNCTEVSLTFSSGYVHTFKYNATEKKYYNYLNKKVMTDGNNGKEMAVENVIALYVPVSILNTKEGHREWNFEATNGEGLYVSNGVGQKVYWSKAGKNAPLKIMSISGQELKISSGQTWIGIVPEANRELTKVVE